MRSSPRLYAVIGAHSFAYVGTVVIGSEGFAVRRPRGSRPMARAAATLGRNQARPWGSPAPPMTPDPSHGSGELARRAPGPTAISMLRRVLVILLGAVLSGIFAHASAANLPSSHCLEASAQQDVASGGADLEGAGNVCSLVCPASACMAAQPEHQDFGAASVRPAVFPGAQVLKYSRAPDTAPPRASSF